MKKLYVVIGIVSLLFSVAEVEISGMLGALFQLLWSIMCLALFALCMLKVRVLNIMERSKK